MESKKINQLATELVPDLSDLTIIGDPTTGISKKITLSQMASLFTGTVEEYANLAAFPLVGVADTIYIALDTNILYRWNTGTSAYVELSPNIVSSLVFNDANGFDGTINLVGSVATLTITTALTTGSVGFIGASGALLQDNANFFWDDTNNRLGLGTNAPTTALDVFGSGIIGRLNGTSTNNAYLGFSSAGTNKWSVGNVQSDHRFRIFSEANSAELVSVLQTGEFGIGIANPTTKLHIDGNASALIANLDANVSVAKSISFRSDNSNRINLEVSGTESGSNAGANFFIRRYSDAGSLIDTPFTILRSSGYVGINIATPANKFAIGGSNSESSLLTYTPTTARQSIINTYYSNAEGLFPQYLDIVSYGQPDGTNGGGIIRFLTNPVTNASAAVERLRINAAGNINIGASATTGKQLIVNQTGATGYFLSGEVSGTEIAYWYYDTSSIQFSSKSATRALTFLTNDIERMNIASDGITRHKFASDRGIRMKGTQSSHSEIAGYQVFTENIRELRLTGSTLQFYTGDGSNSTGAERARITEGGFFKASSDASYYSSTGNYHEIKSSVSDNTMIMWNSSASPNGLFINYTATPNNTGNNFLNFYDSNVGVKRFDVRSNGGISNYQANNVNLSDERTKKDITPLESYWNKFKNIEIVKFKYKDQTHEDFNIGVIAQQVEKVAPEFVDIDGWDNDKPKKEGEQEEIISTEEPLKSIYTADLYHATIKVLQEAMAKIEILEEEVKLLKTK
jgi:hypothetical protein